MDEALQPIIEMNTWVWDRFKRSLAELSPDEVEWRPLPQANNIGVIVRHLRIEAEWHVNCIEGGAPMPAEVTSEMQRSIDSVGLDFAKNLHELEDLYARFIAELSKLSLEILRRQSALAYQGVSNYSPEHMLAFHQAVHLAGHTAQILTIRNLFRQTRGEPARFFPDNPTYPK